MENENNETNEEAGEEVVADSGLDDLLDYIGDKPKEVEDDDTDDNEEDELDEEDEDEDEDSDEEDEDSDDDSEDEEDEEDEDEDGDDEADKSKAGEDVDDEHAESVKIKALEIELANANAKLAAQTGAGDESTEDDEDAGDEFDPKSVAEIFTEENLDEILDDPGKLNEVIAKAIHEGVQAQVRKIQQGAVELMHTSMPQVVATQIEQQQALKSAADSFYAENEQLKPYSSIVAHNINTLAAQNPDWDLPKVMQESAILTYSQLNLTKKAKEDTKKGKASETGLRKKGSKKGNRRNKKRDTRTQMEKDIDSIII